MLVRNVLLVKLNVSVTLVFGKKLIMVIAVSDNFIVIHD